MADQARVVQRQVAGQLLLEDGAQADRIDAAIAADGTTWTWGDNASEQLGNSALPATGTTTPTVVPSFDAVP